MARSSKSFLLFCLVAVIGSLASKSPAPICNGKPSPKIPEQSQAQVAAQQKFCGAFPVVGTVPAIQREGEIIAKAPLVFKQNSSESEATAALTNSSRADSISNNQMVSNRVVISQASSIVEKKKSEEKRLPFIVIGCLLLGYLSIYGFRKWVDTKVKVPQRH